MRSLVSQVSHVSDLNNKEDVQTNSKLESQLARVKRHESSALLCALLVRSCRFVTLQRDNGGAAHAEYLADWKATIALLYAAAAKCKRCFAMCAETGMRG